MKVARPCPSALWTPGLPPSAWLADVSLSEDGVWEGDVDGTWSFDSGLGFSLGLWLGQNGQLGAFPEQQDNWCWLRAACETSPRPLRVLNLFGCESRMTCTHSHD